MAPESFRDTAAAVAATASASPAKASVHAGGTTTNYLRAGSGDVVVLLGESFSDPEIDPLVAVLASAHRVVIPELACPKRANGTPAVAFSSWLRSFLDGLGVTQASIVARDGTALAALAFALTDADRVSRLVISFRDAPDPLDARNALAEQLEEACCRLLVVRETPESRSSDEREGQRRVIAGFLEYSANQ
jgi:pimeloyl-ACP methyl ester carboxylesterase